MTDESRAKTSAALMGHTVSLETRAKQSAQRIGRILSPETRTKISVAKMGHTTSPETRAKQSTAEMGPLNHVWKGGTAVWRRKLDARRRSLGYVYLNVPFSGCEGHHVDNEQVINMPHTLHRSIYHRQDTGQGMAAINTVAYNYLFKQEVEAAMAKVTP